MPQYQLDVSLDRGRWNRLDEFTQGYIEAMFWTECNSDNAELEHATFADLSQTAFVSICADCADFQESNADLLQWAYEAREGYGAENAGHDFWLTRNHHGAGFWDRGLGDVGDQLSKRAHVYGSQDLYMGDDKMVHI